jgi:hypothetical protein
MFSRLLQFSTFILLALIISCSSVTGIDDFGNFRSQISDEALNDETKELFKRNAEVLTFRDQSKRSDDFLELSDDRKNFYYDIQVHIANSDAGKEQPITSNTLIYDRNNLKELIVDPKKNYPFVENWKNKKIITGVEEVDALLKDHDFYVKEFLEWESINKTAFLLRRDKAINTVQITTLLEKSGYFNYAETNNNFTINGGSNISIGQNSDHLIVEYFVNSYDSDGGLYTFKVFEDGTVLFEGKNINQ